MTRSVARVLSASPAHGAHTDTLHHGTWRKRTQAISCGVRSSGVAMLGRETEFQLNGKGPITIEYNLLRHVKKRKESRGNVSGWSGARTCPSDVGQLLAGRTRIGDLTWRRHARCSQCSWRPVERDYRVSEQPACGSRICRSRGRRQRVDNVVRSIPCDLHRK